MKSKIVPLALSFLFTCAPINILAAQKNFDASIKINNNVNDLGFNVDSSIKQENYVVAYNLDNKKILVPYSVLKDNILTFRAPQNASYELINNMKNFTDIKDYSEDIAFVTARELFCGVDENIFVPDMHMTRAMFAQVLANLDGADLTKFDAPNFSDVDKNSWYAPAISWLTSQNLYVTNENSLLFRPNDPITREDMASMLYRYSQNKNFLLWQAGLAVARPPFADFEQITDYARDAVTKLNWSGIILGDANNNFSPKSFATRSEVSSLLRRFVERMTYLN